jgi:hypothetical protein
MTFDAFLCDGAMIRLGRFIELGKDALGAGQPFLNRRTDFESWRIGFGNMPAAVM